MLVSDARSMVYMVVGDSPTAPAYVTTAEVEAYLHEAVARASRRGLLSTMEADLTITPGTPEAPLPDGFIQLEAASYSDRHLEPANRSDLRRMDEEWETRVGDPTHYYMDELQRKIGVWPMPDSEAVSSETPEAPSFLEGDVTTTGGSVIPPVAPSDLTGDPEGGLALSDPVAFSSGFDKGFE